MVETKVAGASLGILTRKVSPNSTEIGREVALQAALADSRLLRYALQSQARELLPDERVSGCLRSVLGATVDILHDMAHERAMYRGLLTCGSIWHCPVCAAKISERRREELAHAVHVASQRGMSVLFATYTFSHTRAMGLRESLAAFSASRKAFNQGKVAQGLKDGIGRLGTVSVLEVTWSKRNGWHPHYHELIFCSGSGDLSMHAYGEMARDYWRKVADRNGLKMNEHGYKLDTTNGAIADYIAKYGHEPISGRAWGAEDELTKGHLKQGRTSERHLTPFGLLRAIFDGENDLRPIWLEYARGFKGHKQLNWSRGLKAMFAVEDKSDEELASEAREEAVLLGSLSREQWQVVLANDARGEVLEHAHTGNWEHVQAFLESLGVVF